MSWAQLKTITVMEGAQQSVLEGGANLWGGVGKGGPLKAFRHLPPQLASISYGLEEEGVLLHTLDAEGVVDASHSCNTSLFIGV